MTDRIQNLVDAGRLSREPASDDEIAGLWANALQAFGDAQVESISANGRLLRAYDAGRIAAAAVVRSRDLRVRAANHHELTLPSRRWSPAPISRWLSTRWMGCGGCGRIWSTAGRAARPTWCGGFSTTAPLS